MRKRSGSHPTGQEQGQRRFSDDPMGTIVLLCPPSPQFVQRDCYCSHLSKASYYWHPYDLVVQSGILATIGPVAVLDAIAEKLSVEKALDWFRQRPVRGVLALVGSITWEADMAFLKHLRGICDAPIFISGDAASNHPLPTLAAYPFITGVLLNYLSRDLARYFSNVPPPYEDLCLRGRAPACQTQKRPSGKRFVLPLPKWELFSVDNYRLPFLQKQPFAPVSASFGCPYRCKFCTAAKLGFRMRDLDDVMAELAYLQKKGFRELHFKDFSFGCHAAHYTELLRRMQKANLGMGFFCLARADHLSLSMAKEMKKAGCHLVHIGAESASPTTLKQYQKQVDPDQVRKAVGNCKKAGIRTLASYVLGLPGETVADMQRTIEYAVELDTDYASFNLFSKRNGWPPAGSKPSGDDNEPVKDLVSHAYRRFYFRPAYLLKQIRSISTVTQLRLAVINAWQLANRHIQYKR